jgi:hypothetical protein
MQLARVIEVGMDVDGDAVADINSSRIYFGGISAGSMIGTILLALDPSIAVGVLASSPGLVPESVRWQPVRRAGLGSLLASRTPSLINIPGVTTIDGVPTAEPFFDENKPLRDLPVLINTVDGAMEIQRSLEFAEMVEETGLTPVTWARYLRRTPLPGLYGKSVIYQFAKGDQNATNPGTSALIREGGLEDRTLYYRHDLAFATDPTMPQNPHLFGGMANAPNATFRAVARGAQDQMGTFLASDGVTTIHPTPTQFFEVPIVGSLPETLNFIAPPPVNFAAPPPVLNLSPVTWLWVMVVDDTGACIVPATIEIVGSQNSGHSMTQATPCSVWDDAGGVQLRGLNPDEALTLRASAPDYTPREVPVVPRIGPQQVFEIKLSKRP